MSKLSINYIGQCGFIIANDKLSIAIDPVLNDIADENGKTVRAYQALMSYSELQVDYILCTHEHIDHMALETICEVAKLYPRTRYIVPKGCIKFLLEAGIGMHLIIGLTDGECIRLEQGELEVTGMSTAHPEHSVDDEGLDCNLAYGIRMSDKMLVHLGDTYQTERLLNSLKALGKIDILMPPINGRDEEREARGIIGNLSSEEVAGLANTLGAELTIPTHFDMIIGNTENPDNFVDELSGLNPNAKYWIPNWKDDRYLEVL